MAFRGAKVLNGYPQPVQCWTGEPTAATNNDHFFLVQGDGGVSPDDVDVDHVKDSFGQGYKCGESILSRRVVVIERSGVVREAKCKTNGPNQDCADGINFGSLAE